MNITPWLRHTFAGIVAVACSFQAAAQDEWYDFDPIDSTHSAGAWYVAGFGSYLMPQDSEWQALTDAGFPNDIELDDSWGLGLSVGKYAGPFRLEAELAYRDFEVGGADVAGASDVTASGDGSSISLMGNGFVDIPLNDHADFFVGGGAGYANVKADLRGTDSGVTVALDEDDDWVFVYQVMAGFAIDVSRTTKLTLGYRGFTGGDIEMGSGDYDFPWVNSIDLGLRFAF